MTITGTITRKETIPTELRAAALKKLALSHFTTDEQGATAYTPFYGEIAQFIYFCLNYLEGVTFTNTDDIYACVQNNREIKDLYLEAMKSDFGHDMTLVEKMVDFEKEKLLQKHVTVTSVLDVLAVPLSELIAKMTEQLSVLSPEQLSALTHSQMPGAAVREHAHAPELS